MKVLMDDGTIIYTYGKEEMERDRKWHQERHKRFMDDHTIKIPHFEGMYSLWKKGM